MEEFLNKKSNRIRSGLPILFLLVYILSGLGEESLCQQLAFPTAEGWGKFTKGGRGGKVYEVTNLNDSGAGSLRDAVNASGPRTVVFRISGTIDLKSNLNINNPYITIAGQTAPGDGICIKRYQISVNTHDVILRYLRIRLGDESGGESDAIGGRFNYNIIIDHCSASWSEDETLSFYHNDSLTVQWCLISESLYNSNHPKGHHGFGGIWGGPNATFHHNLLAHHSSRNPRFASGSGYTDYRNNVVYNWGYNSTYGGENQQQGDTRYSFSKINMVANYYKPGPGTKSGELQYRIVEPSSRSGADDYGKWYVADNYVYGNQDATNDNVQYGVQGIGSVGKKVIISDTPFVCVPIKQQTAEEAYQLVLDNVGATLPKRDSLDQRIIQETATGTATYGTGTYNTDQGFNPSIPTGMIDSQTDVGGWPVLKSEPAPADSDHDGMPDNWETDHGLNPNDPEDRNGIGEGGYTNLEIYLNNMINYPTDVKEYRGSLPTEFNLEQNYPNPFNPSTKIGFSIPFRTNVKIDVYDIMGRKVDELLNEEKPAGRYEVNFIAKNLSSGVYIYQLTYVNNILSRKMMLLK